MQLRISLVALLMACATAARADMYADCNQAKDAARAMQGCSAIIERGNKEPVQNRVAAYTRRGTASAAQRDHNRAIADFSQAIELAPNYAPAFYNRGNSHQLKGEYDHAIADYGRAIEINPNYAAAFAMRGYVFQLQGRKEQAVADSKKALEIDPSNQNAKSNLKELGLDP